MLVKVKYTIITITLILPILIVKLDRGSGDTMFKQLAAYSHSLVTLQIMLFVRKHITY